MKTPKPNGLAIVLDHPDISYFPGEVVSGKVRVLFQSVLKNISQVKLTIHVEGAASIFAKKKVKGAENYFSTDICLFENDNFRTTPSEDSSFPFRFALPSNLPSSFSCKKGEVSYTITALLKSSSLKETHPPHSLTVPFQVTGFVDLNREPRICDKITFSKAKTNGCFWGKNGPVGFKVSIPRKGFIPGETIPVSVEMTNTSKNQVKKTQVQLVQWVKCISKRPQSKKPIQNVIVDEIGPGIKPGEYKTWSASLNIPKIAPTGLAGCKLIEVVYKLRFEMDLGGIHPKLFEETYILIGSIPIRTNSPELVPIDMIRSQLLNKVHSAGELNKKEANNNQSNSDNSSSPPPQMQKRVSFAVEEILSSESSSVSSMQESSDSNGSDEEEVIKEEQISLMLDPQRENNQVSTEEDVNNKVLGLCNFSTSYVRVFNNVPTSVLVN